MKFKFFYGLNFLKTKLKHNKSHVYWKTKTHSYFYCSWLSRPPFWVFCSELHSSCSSYITDFLIIQLFYFPHGSTHSGFYEIPRLDTVSTAVSSVIVSSLHTFPRFSLLSFLFALILCFCCFIDWWFCSY